MPTDRAKRPGQEPRADLMAGRMNPRNDIDYGWLYRSMKNHPDRHTQARAQEPVYPTQAENRSSYATTRSSSPFLPSRRPAAEREHDACAREATTHPQQQDYRGMSRTVDFADEAGYDQQQRMEESFARSRNAWPRYDEGEFTEHRGGSEGSDSDWRAAGSMSSRSGAGYARDSLGRSSMWGSSDSSGSRITSRYDGSRVSDAGQTYQSNEYCRDGGHFPYNDGFYHEDDDEYSRGEQYYQADEYREEDRYYPAGDYCEQECSNGEDVDGSGYASQGSYGYANEDEYDQNDGYECDYGNGCSDDYGDDYDYEYD
ncbi:hypothetical protein DM02DRAFT_670261 [Periconia macrospinosa]|uniref:Uncharacterized protein n=1 Tax=Periconia macrospinosa TaxID=97972 RepID=A0A2V1DXV7_9PLEO|nr:hypothetical protein DM02DRAFT_670261 [Periconia macrospinosa]